MITTVAVITKLRIYQELLSAIVGSRPGFAVIAISANEHDATQALVSQRPDVAMLDANLPGVWNVAEAAQKAAVRFIIFGLADSPQPLEAAARAGAVAVLTTGATSRQVLESLERIRCYQTPPPDQPAEMLAITTLTDRELEVLSFVARGLSNKEIANKLTVSLPTVKTHVHNVLCKLGARRRGDAGRLLHLATSHGAIEPYRLPEMAVSEVQPSSRREQRLTLTSDAISRRPAPHNAENSDHPERILTR
jgi:two-component system nitrate/nitrite response regulator NarL